MWEFMSGNGWWLGFGAVHMVLFWGLIILSIMALANIVFGVRNDERYARDEIATDRVPSQKGRAEDALSG